MNEGTKWGGADMATDISFTQKDNEKESIVFSCLNLFIVAH